MKSISLLRLGIILSVGCSVTLMVWSGGDVYAASLDCSTALNINVAQAECDALTDLYDNTNGSSWTIGTNWATDTDVCTWYGVTCANLSGQDSVITLSLPTNNLVGMLSSTLPNLTNLIYLDLSDNVLNGPLPSWTGLSDLQYLYLNNNQLSGPLPDSWTGFASIAYIDVSHNSLSGLLPDAWSTLSTMVYLDISDNNFDGGLPDAWSTWTSIQTLYASGSSLTGSLPNSWSALDDMLYFDVSNNDFDGGLPSSRSTWIDAQTLAFHDSSLDGVLPSSWSTMSSLLSFDLSNNAFTGSIPTSRDTMTAMTHMDLGHNQIGGTIPSSRSGWTDLAYLDVGYNQIAGSLPSSWSSLVNMAYFDVSNNQIVGNLPSGWSSRTGMQGFFASDNLLTGLIPSLWITSRPNPSSQYIDLANNCINVSSYPIPILSWISSNVYTSPQNVCLTYSADTGGTLSGTTFQSIASGGSGTTVEAISDSGYDFTQWSDGYTGAVRTDTNITGDITVTAQFTGVVLSGSNNAIGSSSHGGGGGGGSLIIDNCPNGDLSPSYYDASCAISGVDSSGSSIVSNHGVALSGSSITPSFTISTEHTKTISDAIDICRSHTGELQRAYCFAGEMGYSIVQEIPLTSSKTKVSRGVMASIITRFASSIGNREVDAQKLCLFNDVSSTGSLANFIHLSCQMNLMGVDTDYISLPKFYPRKILSKEQFLTTVSRMLYNHRYEIDPSQRESYTYGYRHIKRLYQQKIIKSPMSQGPATRDFIYLTLYKVVKMLIVTSSK